MDPGPENYLELEKQIKQARDLDPKFKEILRDRIAELEFQREETKTFPQIAATIGLTAIATLIGTYVFISNNNDWTKPFGMLIIIVLCYVIYQTIVNKITIMNKKDLELKEKFKKIMIFY